MKLPEWDKWMARDKDGKFYSGEKSRRSPSPNKPTPRPTKN